MGNIKPSQIAYLTTTSGTTGKPKIIATTHTSALNTIQDCVTAFATTDMSYRVAGLSSYAFDASIFEILFSLANGYTLCLPDTNRALLGNALANFIISQKIEWVLLTPTVLSSIPCNSEFPILKKMIIGGEPSTFKIVQQWLNPKVDLYIAYGAAETCIISTVMKVSNVSDYLKIGVPLQHTICQVRNVKGNIAATNELGRLYIAGNIGRYFNPNIDEKKFLLLTHDKKSLPFFSTDDIVYCNNEGHLVYSHRDSHAIKINGVLINPHEIIGAISLLENIYHIVLFSAQLKGQIRKKLICTYSTQNGNRIPHNILLSHVASHLPKQKIPSSFMHIKHWPISFSGKVDKNQLAEIVKLKFQKFELAPLAQPNEAQLEL